MTGGELSLLNKGFLLGETLPARINAFLGRAAAVVRERFGGKITYASIPFGAATVLPWLAQADGPAMLLGMLGAMLLRPHRYAGNHLG